MTLTNGDTWSSHPRIKKLSELKNDPKHACMFIFQESTGMNYVITIRIVLMNHLSELRTE